MTLTWRGDLAEHVIPGKWEFIISTDNVAIQAEVFHGHYEGARTEIIINTTGVTVSIFDAPDVEFVHDIVFQDNSLVLHFADGKTKELPTQGASGGGTDIISVTYYFDDLIHPKDVVRVTFRGAQIGD